MLYICFFTQWEYNLNLLPKTGILRSDCVWVSVKQVLTRCSIVWFFVLILLFVITTTTSPKFMLCLMFNSVNIKWAIHMVTLTWLKQRRHDLSPLFVVLVTECHTSFWDIVLFSFVFALVGLWWFLVTVWRDTILMTQCDICWIQGKPKWAHLRSDRVLSSYINRCLCQPMYQRKCLERSIWYSVSLVWTYKGYQSASDICKSYSDCINTRSIQN